MKRKKFSFFKLFSLLFLSLFWFQAAFGQASWLNEIMTNNASLIQDDDGDFSDWIEIYNNAETPLDLSGWYLSDDPNQLSKWQFPSYSVLPGAYILVFASDKDKTEGAFFHTNFKLKAAGESLYVSNPEGILIETIAIPSLNPHSSYGRSPNGEGNFNIFFSSSPWGNNNNEVVEATLSCSENSGFYDDYPSINISGNNNTDEIYYSLNGSIPVPGSTYTFLYTGTFVLPEIDPKEHIYTNIPSTPLYETLHPWMENNKALPKGITLRAASFKNGIQNSLVLNRSFFINTSHDLPIISLMVDSCDLFNYNKGIYVPGQFLERDLQKSGNYFQTGKDWERNCSFQYFSANGTLAIDQTAGIRIHGNLSRIFPQKSLRLYARSEYGKNSFAYPFFTDNSFNQYKRLILRTPQVSQRAAFFKDALVHEWSKQLGLHHMSSQASVVYLNGEFWGIYTIRERLDRFYLSQHFGIEKGTYDHLSGIGDVLEGSNEAYNELITYIRNHNMADEEAYQWVSSRIDLANYIDYVIFETYISNIDWPGNNIEYWKKKDGKWQWLLIDTDAALGDPYYNMLEHSTTTEGMPFENPEWSTLMFRSLVKNTSFKERFITRYMQLINEEFDYNKIMPLIDKYERLYYPEISNQANRWNFPSSTTEFANGVADLHYFFKNRPCIVKQQLEEFFDTSLAIDVCEKNPITDGGISPNPNNGNFLIHYFSNKAISASIRVHSFNGELLFEKEIQLMEGYHSYPVDIQFLNSGLYITSIYSDNKLWQRKTIKL